MDNKGTVLLTQRSMIGFGGSEMVTLELAEFFSSAGFSVIIFSREFGPPMTGVLATLPNVASMSGDSESALDMGTLKLVWVHHQVIPQQILDAAIRGALTAPVIFHHMSSFAVDEMPFLLRCEIALATMILYNSSETQDHIEGRYFSTLEKRRSLVFGNPAPASFFRPTSSIPTHQELHRLLVVSNHLPREVAIALELLESHGVGVLRIGRGGDQYGRLSVEDLWDSQAILTIGKSVQYGIVAGVPVFCYDRFGGPGYLTQDNFHRAKHYNFSGRGFAKMSPEEISKSLMTDWGSAKEYSRLLHQTSHASFLLETRLDELFATINIDPVSTTVLPEDLLPDVFAAWDCQRILNQASRAELELKSEIQQLRRSLSWRLTRPLRILSRVARRRSRTG